MKRFSRLWSAENARHTHTQGDSKLHGHLSTDDYVVKNKKTVIINICTEQVTAREAFV